MNSKTKVKSVIGDIIKNVISWIKKKLKHVWDWFVVYQYDLVFLFVLLIAVGTIYVVGEYRPVSLIVITWVLILIVMADFVFCASFSITKNPLFGWLINEQNRISLSRLQMFMWTIVILSAYVTAVFANLHCHEYIDKALNIAIPSELWFAMGISTTSLVGTVLILEDKKGNTVLVTSKKPHIYDLIDGEEEGNKDKIDLSRLQNLFFTFILVGTYILSLKEMFTTYATRTQEIHNIAGNLAIIEKFPELGSGAVALLAISHAGYLGAKAIQKPRSKGNDRDIEERKLTPKETARKISEQTSMTNEMNV